MTAIVAKPPPIPEPIWLITARAELGQKEAPGTADNKRIIEYLRATNLPKDKWHDSTAHCAAFVSWCLGMSGMNNPRFASARSYLSYGTGLDRPRVGCIVVFSRPPSPMHGHVAFYVEQPPVPAGEIAVLGANQHDQVCVAGYAAARLLGYRWPV